MEKVNNDVDEAFRLLKIEKTKTIVSQTAVSIDIAFDMYQRLNGDVTGAIERLNYYNDSKEWEKENSPSLIDFINKINETEPTYDVFDYIPQKSEPFQFKVLELLYNFYEMKNISMRSRWH